MSSNDLYKQSGVDIEAGDSLVEAIKPLAKSTNRKGVYSGLGGFGGLFDLKACGFKDPILVAGTDGVGTKLKIAIDLGIHDTIGIDLVAMCVNDLVVQGAEPLFFLDYYATGKLSVATGREIIKGIAEGCKQAGTALIGGETAEMPGLYSEGDYDLAGFAIGAVERENILPRTDLKEGDVLIGIASSGVHSNGFSLVRHILKNNNIKFTDNCDFSDKSIGEVLLTPTKIYIKSCLAAIKSGKVKALAHITGGGLTENLPRVLTEEFAVEIDATSFKLPKIFAWLKQIGNVTNREMLRTFNSGIGMVLITSASDAQEISDILKANGEETFIIGKVTKRQPDAVTYKNLDELN